MATTANKNCKQFIGIVTGEDGITARSGDEPGKGTVKLKTVEINESESTSSETVYQISETGSTDVEVYNYTEMAFAKDEEVEIWQDGYGVFWVTPTKNRFEYFIINKNWNGEGTPPNTPSIFTKGSLHYVRWDGSDWVPHSDNEATSPSSPMRPSGAKLVVCQEDAPNDAKDYRMPYYTPEDNMGVPPTISSVWNGLNGDRAGVVPGEHVFTNKWLDYEVTSTRSFAYNPNFTDEFEAVGQTGGNQYLYIEHNNQQYQVFYPNSNSFMGWANNSYPDIYPGDKILVAFNAAIGTGVAVDYPTDYPDGTVMPWYTPRLGTPLTSYLPGRGWQPYDPYGSAHGEIAVERIDKNGAHYNAAGDCVFIESGTSDKVAVKEGCLRFVEKIKTGAIT